MPLQHAAEPATCCAFARAAMSSARWGLSLHASASRGPPTHPPVGKLARQRCLARGHLVLGSQPPSLDQSLYITALVLLATSFANSYSPNVSEAPGYSANGYMS
eukprot:9698146-Alexandrium_andersonii.AAC.1